MPLILLIVLVSLCTGEGVDFIKRHWNDFKSGSVSRSSGSRGTRFAAAAKTDAGYWARSAATGFPQFRHGFAESWHRHRRDHDILAAKRARSRADSAETRARILPEIDGHKQRYRQAQEQIRARRSADEPDQEQPPQEEPGAISSVVHPSHRYCLEPGCSCHESRRLDGEPETEADKRFFDERESGYTGPLDQDGRRPDPDDPEAARDMEILERLQNGHADMEDGLVRVTQVTKPDGTRFVSRDTDLDRLAVTYPQRDGYALRPAEGEETAYGFRITRYGPSTTTTPEGNQMATATDINYPEVIRRADALKAETEQLASDIAAAQKRFEEVADGVAAVDADSQTQGEAMDLAGALGDAASRVSTLQEQADQFRRNVAQRHGGIHEAVQDAPIPEPADKPFYVEG